MQLSQHPWGAVLPPIPADDLMKLEASVRKLGVLHPIVILDDMVLTGWHRYQTAMKLGVECPMIDYDQALHGEDPRAFVAAEDLHRRHIPSAIQRVNLVEKLFATAGPGRPTTKPRQDDDVSQPATAAQDSEPAAAQPAPVSDETPLANPTLPASPPLTRRQVADMAETSTATVDRARAERKREASAGDEVRERQNARAQRADRRPTERQQRADDTLNQLRAIKRELTVAKRRIADLESLERLRADQDRPDTAERVQELVATQRDLEAERTSGQTWMARYQDEQKRSAYYLRLLRKHGIDPTAPDA